MMSEKSCLISCGEISIDDHWKKTARKLRMSRKKIENFVEGEEGMNLLRQDSVDSKKYNVSGSPTLLINGKKSNSIYADTKDVKAAICSAFTLAPNECK
jgi:DSBA-like thioredoxin domain-containing protein